jgi:L-ascorbate metabolism protein UlaG (beta-lactamase superfamily)
VQDGESRSDPGISIRFLGTAAFDIRTASGKRLLIDPYLEENAYSPLKVADLEDVDLLLVTHAAYDHLGDTLAIMKRYPDLPLVAGVDVRGYLMAQGIEGTRIWSSPWGMMIEVAGVRIRPVESRHWSYIQLDDGRSFSSIPLAYIIYASNDVRIYHSGDTTIFSDMKLIGQLYQPTIGLINVGVPREHRGAEHGVPEYLTGEMTASEAALACRWLGLKEAIPCHHDDIELPEIVDFKARLESARQGNDGGCKPILLKPGQVYENPVAVPFSDNEVT